MARLQMMIALNLRKIIQDQCRKRLITLDLFNSGCFSKKLIENYKFPCLVLYLSLFFSLSFIQSNLGISSFRIIVGKFVYSDCPLISEIYYNFFFWF